VTRGSERPSPLHIAYDEIAEIQAYPVPEGSAPPPLIRNPTDTRHGDPLASVRTDIPTPFPAPVPCDYSGDGDGLQLTVSLRDGTHLDYLACAFPPELKPLLDDAFQQAAGRTYGDCVLPSPGAQPVCTATPRAPVFATGVFRGEQDGPLSSAFHQNSEWSGHDPHRNEVIVGSVLCSAIGGKARSS
jgi:hypothetical protein